MQYLSCFVAPWASIHSSTHWGGNSKHFFVSLHWGEAPNRTDMYCNGKYNRYGLFANTISAGVAPFLMGLLSVCSNFLKIIRKKCAENLVVCDIRINTHTHCSRASRYKLSLNRQCVSEKVISGFSRFFPPSTSELQYTSAMSLGESRIIPGGDMRNTVCTRMSPSCVMSNPEKSMRMI